MGGKSEKVILQLFDEYKKDFIVQQKLLQHDSLSRLNTTSLNTMRLFTYRSMDGKINNLDDMSFVRFGEKGAILDNGSVGGSLCHVLRDGTVSDNSIRFKDASVKSLETEKGICNLKIHNYDKARKMGKHPTPF